MNTGRPCPTCLRFTTDGCVCAKPHPHINAAGRFQSDKYPTCPPGKVPLSTKDPTAQDLLWMYAQRRRSVDAEFADDLEFALRADGYVPPFRVVVAKTKRALYFGYGSGGHFLRMSDHNSTLDPERSVPGFPWSIQLLDTGLLKNGRIVDDPDGRVYWTCGGTPLWLAFYWWDRSGDARPASNSGFYVQGFSGSERKEAFEFACSQWPQVVARQHHPLVLVEMEGRP